MFSRGWQVNFQTLTFLLSLTFYIFVFATTNSKTFHQAWPQLKAPFSWVLARLQQQPAAWEGSVSHSPEQLLLGLLWLDGLVAA